ncbi:assimilatory sulfite reductase (NADPH) flavoprotein subunit [Hymenobacter terricola]|uniref:assimilatory sulfite reductase (NADPH) flavoprotein subunit n=1 Tax=Hymenobacter terricola TaxID=2819236 RepID=UPI001B317844|nr:assimilatory sulfite reductase (NADPH) flavoprotein subunit [Hymenobacter terricola]
MPTPANISANPAGFDDDTLQRLTSGLNAQQLLWLSGYLYGRAGAGASAPAPAASFAKSVGAAPQLPRLTILYGSQTGNSKKVALQTAELARQRGLTDVVVQDMNDYAGRTLQTERRLLVVVSTQGEGDAPISAEDLHQFLGSSKAPKLPELRYAVLALGDRSYLQFCQTGQEFDERLAALGAQRLVERVDCDVDFQEPARQWAERVLAELLAGAQLDSVAAEVGIRQEATPSSRIVVPAGPAVNFPLGIELEEPLEYSRHNPFFAPVLEKIQLNGRGSSKETFHLELSLAGSGLRYEPGDSLAVLPVNGAQLVAEVVQAARLHADAPVRLDETELDLATALTGHRELTTLTRDVLERYAGLSPRHGRLRELLDGDRTQLQHYLYGRDVADLLTEYPAELSAQHLVAVLRPLQSRAYSIASSLLAHPDEAHLTVGALRYHAQGRHKRGAASTFLAEQLGIDGLARVFVERNEYFKLPTDPDTDIIMVGAGTGVAPFRAFVEERVELGAAGRNWLLFGNPHFTTDFLYQTEWQQHLKRGGLHQFDVAFSRDQADKLYVQHRLLENARDVFGWLENGAHFYVCGDKTRLASAIQTALTTIVQQQGGFSADDAAAYVHNLKKQRRYLEDVY